jgi:hypothetical protein
VAASAIGQLNNRVIGHLPRPVQRQKDAEAQKQKPLRQKNREFFPSADHVTALLFAGEFYYSFGPLKPV